MLDKEIRESVLKGTGGSTRGNSMSCHRGGEHLTKSDRESGDTGGAENSLTVFLTKEGLELKSAWDLCQPNINYCLLYYVANIYQCSMYSNLICVKLIIYDA